MKSYQIFVLLVLSFMLSSASFADVLPSNSPGPGCYGTFSEIEASVMGEGIVISYVSPVDGEQYVYNYGLLHSGPSWWPICPVELPANTPNALTITLTMPTQAASAVFDSAAVDPEAANDAYVPLQIKSSTQKLKDAVMLTLQVTGLKTALASTTGNALLFGKIFDSNTHPENYLGQVIVPFVVNQALK